MTKRPILQVEENEEDTDECSEMLGYSDCDSKYSDPESEVSSCHEIFKLLAVTILLPTKTYQQLPLLIIRYGQKHHPTDWAALHPTT